MNVKKPAARPGNGVLTRRQTIQALAAAGVAASPLIQRSAAADEVRQNGSSMVAAIFFESYATIALRRALDYAGDDGFVASMPTLLHARVNAEYDNILWNTWFSANSEESVVTTQQGNHVVVTVHGGGILSSPARRERSLRADLSRHNSEGLTGQYALRISEHEARSVLQGSLPDGSEIPVYPFAEFANGIGDLPMRYAVVLDFDIAKNGKNGYEPFEVLKDDHNMIVRAGGVEPLAAYLDKARSRHDTELMGNWHSHERIDPSEPQARVLYLSGNEGGVGSEGKNSELSGNAADFGMSATWPAGLARFVAVAPRDVSASLRHLDFEF